jgi:prepilin-type N-terminal cleavage/methylation domain-containing protein/prepilin-type processing-associated H-X9-DG protein
MLILRRRRGFTLIELLVVIAIIVLLMALLLPAVQKVREAANKMICGNNLKNIGIAMHNFYNDYNRFPNGGWEWNTPIYYNNPGNVPNSNPAPVGKQLVGWMFQILPYMEQDNIYRAPDGSRPGDGAGAQGPVATAPQKAYFCPSRRPVTVGYTGRVLQDYASAVPGWDPNNLGSNDDFDWGWGDRYDHKGVISRLGFNGNLSNPNNARFYDIKITFALIVDGSSNTLVVGEKFMRPIDYLVGSFADDAGYSCGWDQDIVRMTKVPLIPDYNVDDGASPTPVPDYWNQHYGFGGAHAGGMNGLMGDGSVRSFPWQIDRNLWWRIGQRNDGVAISLP